MVKEMSRGARVLGIESTAHTFSASVVSEKDGVETVRNGFGRYLDPSLSRDRKVDALCLSVRSLHELRGLLDGDRHRRSCSSLERGLRTPMLRRFFS